MGKYLEYHEKFLREGLKHPSGFGNEVGLCCATSYDSGVELFAPDENEYDYRDSHPWWGSDDDSYSFQGVYGPLRQNVILFLAAMNNEL